MKFNDDIIRTPEDLQRALKDKPDLKIFTVAERPPELKIYTEMDGLTGEEIRRTPEVEKLSWLAAVKIQLECLRDVLRRKAK